MGDRDESGEPNEPVEDAAGHDHAIRRLVGDLRADPGRLAERLAQFAVQDLGPRADASVAAMTAAGTDRADQQKAVAASGVRRTIAQGSVVGGPLLVFIPVAFCAALLSQLRMALELGAVAGRPADDPQRAADLLVLQNAYPSAAAAQAALTASSAPRSSTSSTPKRRSAWIGTVVRMAYLLGLLTKGPKRSLLRQAGYLAYYGALFVVGFLAPLIWIPAMGWSYRQATITLARRAVLYFDAEATADAASGTTAAATTADLDDPVRLKQALDVHISLGSTVALLRATVVALLPLIAAVVIVATDTRLTGNRWTTAAVGLIVLTALFYAVWFTVRRRRRRIR